MPLETIEVPRSNDVDKPDEIPLPNVENKPLNGASFEDTMDVMLDKELLIMLGSLPKGWPMADSERPFLKVSEKEDTLALRLGNLEPKLSNADPMSEPNPFVVAENPANFVTMFCAFSPNEPNDWSEQHWPEPRILQIQSLQGQ